jgi:hypothetical protein
MKDLDFDELDRAVNSLMTNVPKSEPQADGTPEKTLDIPSTSGDGDELSFDKVTEAAKKVTDEAPMTDTTEKSVVSPTPEPRASAVAQHASNSVRPTAPVPANRRGGRFMDVVHPSADMSKPDSPKPISRQGLNLEPLNSSSQKIADVVPQKKDAAETAPKAATSVEENTPEEKPTTATPVPQEPAKTATPDEPTSENKPTSDWPDPLDMMTSEPEKKEETPSEPEMPQVEAEPETSAPLTSPFLPDAKVEKRPLGGTATEDDTPIEEDAISRAPMADDIKKSVDDPNKQLPANPTEVEQVLPEELSGDLMAVEADTTHAELKRAHDENQAPSSPVAAEKPAAAQDFEPKEPSTKPATPVEEASVPAGPTSIPQQYKEEPSTGDQDNGSIYDTDTYHQPLAHPAKKKSGWMWVVWIALILAVGAGGGALLYILKLV